MLDLIDSFLSASSSVLWGSILFVALVGTHLYLTILLRFPQRHLFQAMRYYFARRTQKEGQISNFSTLMISLAANIGTGNIIGVATALAVGGPGAVFWCAVTGVLGISTRYAESLLASRYRVLDSGGAIVGGPMYVLERALKYKRLAILFALLTAVAAFGIGNITQANAASQVLATSALAVPTWVTGLVLSILVACVLLGGLKSISKVCSTCVPTMALIYLVGCALILFSHSHFIIPAVDLIVTSAFSSQAAAGGFVGGTIMLAMQTGVQRGLFSNEAGMGSAPIVSAPAQTPNCVYQALIASTGPFWDTVVICSITGVTLTCCIMAEPVIGQADPSVMSYHAFGTVGAGGSILLSISLLTFVISTLLGWSYFGERALQYLGGHKLIKPYRVLWVLVVFVGCVIPKSSLVWNFADCANGLMALPNIIAMLALSGVLVKETRYYLWGNRLEEEDTRVIPRRTEPEEEA